MKKIFLFIVIFSLVQFGAAVDDPAPVKTEIGEDAREMNELQVRLGLDDFQVDELKKIFSAAESQRQIDIEIFRASATALIRAAERRREITDNRILDMLKDNQKNQLELYIKARELNDELFRLRHGLLLTGKQVIEVDLIISEYRNSLERMYKKLDYFIRSGEDRKKKSSESSRLLSSRSQGLERRTPAVKQLEMGPPEKIREIQSEKAKRIREYLDEEQKMLFKEFLKYQDQQLEVLIKRLRK